MPISIARRYARALHAVAKEASEVDATLKALETLSDAIAESSDLAGVLESPQITRDQRRAVLLEIASKAGFGPLVQNFLQLLVDRDRTPELPFVARLFRELADETAGRVRAEVTTALPLSDAEAKELEAALAKATGKTVVLTRREDPEIIGGLEAKVGDTLYDGSLKTQLARMRTRALG
ncbi:MAG: F0F1 ATP synthase subunit delta [Deltaproteobacteria bacterium]|nr:F0F1 ATP synthase subunit delta [Deltaproteobacteria bacterium]